MTRAKYLANFILSKEEREEKHQRLLRRKRAWRMLCRDKINSRLRATYWKDVEKSRADHNARIKIIRSNNPIPHRTAAVARRARLLSAMPPWADRAAIAAKYMTAAQATAESGLLHVVDHFYPLKHKLFSGLHIPCNLRVILHHANASKGNCVTQNMLAPRFA